MRLEIARVRVVRFGAQRFLDDVEVAHREGRNDLVEERVVSNQAHADDLHRSRFFRLRFVLAIELILGSDKIAQRVQLVG